MCFNSSCSLMMIYLMSSATSEPCLLNMELEDDIDEDNYTRQIAVYGRKTMKRLLSSNVLISGMKGLGIEIGNTPLVNVSCLFSSFH